MNVLPPNLREHVMSPTHSEILEAFHRAEERLDEFKVSVKSSNSIDKELMTGSRTAIQSSRDLIDEVDREREQA